MQISDLLPNWQAEEVAGPKHKLDKAVATPQQSFCMTGGLIISAE